MEYKRIKNALIIGAGEMGWQITLLLAQNRLKVVLHDIQTDMLTKAQVRIEGNLQKRISKGKMSEERSKKTLDRISYSSNWKEIIEQVDLVIETAPEKLELKKQIFQELSKVVKPNVICATNSSTIIINKIVEGLPEKFKENCANIHFSNPPFVLTLIELFSPTQNDILLNHLKKHFRKFGSHPIIFRKPISGFIMNRLLGAALLEAIKLVEDGVCSIEDIDTACTAGLNWPIGLGRLADYIGLDTVHNSIVANYNETKEEYLKPPKIIQDLVEKGQLGIKTKQGFYKY